MLYQSGAALLDAGRQAEGEARLAQVVTTLTDQPAAYQALRRLLGSDAQALDKGLVGYDVACRAALKAGKPVEALGYCDSFRGGAPAGPGRANAAWYTARAYEDAGNADQAAIWFRGFTEVYTSDFRLPDGLLRWGDVLNDSGDTAGAMALYDRLGAEFPQSAAAATAADHAGVLLRRQSDLAGAAERWRRAAAAPGRGRGLARARHILAGLGAATTGPRRRRGDDLAWRRDVRYLLGRALRRPPAGRDGDPNRRADRRADAGRRGVRPERRRRWYAGLTAGRLARAPRRRPPAWRAP